MHSDVTVRMLHPREHQFLTRELKQHTHLSDPKPHFHPIITQIMAYVTSHRNLAKPNPYTRTNHQLTCHPKPNHRHRHHRVHPSATCSARHSPSDQPCKPTQLHKRTTSSTHVVGSLTSPSTLTRHDNTNKHTTHGDPNSPVARDDELVLATFTSQPIDAT